jgi:hypothetical protein
MIKTLPTTTYEVILILAMSLRANVFKTLNPSGLKTILLMLNQNVRHAKRI